MKTTNILKFRPLFSLLLLIPLFLFFFNGCRPTGKTEDLAGTTLWHMGSNQTARISVFLNLKKTFGPDISMDITTVEIHANGVWRPLTSGAVEIDAVKIGMDQIFIAGHDVPADLYDRVKFTLGTAAIGKENEKTPLKPDNLEIEVALPDKLTISKGDSKSLFVTWDTEASLANEGRLAPVFTIAKQTIPLVADLAFSACPRINTIYLIRTDKNRVCGSIGVVGHPSYLAVNQSNTYLYVLTAWDSSIKVIELSTHRTVDVIRLPATLKPTFMTLSPNSQSAYLLDERGNRLVLLDLPSGTISNNVMLGHRPQYVLCLPDHNQLAVSSSMSQSVYLVDPVKLTTEEVIPVGSDPQGLLVWNDLLYIAESRLNTVTVYDLRDHQILKRIRVGSTPRRLFNTGNTIFVANHKSGDLSTLVPGQLTTFRTIKTGEKPLEMTYSENQRWLYVGDEGRGEITVIDNTSKRVERRIMLGTPPLGLAVLN